MWKVFISDYYQALRKWLWEVIIGPIVVAVGLPQQIVNKAINIPIWGWIIIGLSTVFIGQLLAYRSLWLKLRTDALDNWIEKYQMEKGELPTLPDYLHPLVANYKAGQPVSKDIRIITPSGQAWNKLLPSQQKAWRDLVRWKGEEPEDYLEHMRQMFPKTPKGAK